MYSVYLVFPNQKAVVYQGENLISARRSAGQIYSRRHHKRIDTILCDGSGKVLLKLEAKFK